MRALFFFATIILAGCSQPNNTEQLNAKIDSLQQQLNNTYKPRFGEVMLNIQMHHAKLWFAGINDNWKLAAFEIDEIKEAIDDIQKYDSERAESKSISMINGSMDSIATAIQQKDVLQFKNSFILLTNTCNNCHRATNHEFNVVTVPTALPVVNQNFKGAH